MDPCTQNNCKLECIANYCGGCSYQCVCATDDNCQNNEFCDTDSKCTPLTIIVGEGESCGGFRLPPVPQCESSLICINTLKFLPDSPGICRRQCSTNEDCPQEQYCSEEGVCLEDAQCLLDSDCSNSGNVFETPEINCTDNSEIRYCNGLEGMCKVVRNNENISCSSSFDCPTKMYCEYRTNICRNENKCEDEGACGGPPMGMPNIICSDGSIGGPICEENQKGECQWQIKECPSTCSCGAPPPLSLCPNGQPPLLSCQPITSNTTNNNNNNNTSNNNNNNKTSNNSNNNNNNTSNNSNNNNNNNKRCEWSIQCINITTCDCSTFPIPEIAKQCPDGSYIGATCVATPSGCSYEFQCPNMDICSEYNAECSHPIGGSCLGICDKNFTCVLSAFDYCLNSPATVFTISLKKFVSDQELIVDLSSFSLLSLDKIYILGSTNREFNVEFVDDKKVSAENALENLQSNISNGDVNGSSLESARVFVLSTNVNQSSDANQSTSASNNDSNNDNDSSSASLLIANLFVLFLFTLL